MIELILFLIPFIYYCFMTIVTMKSQIAKNLEELLKSTNTFIITDNLNYSKKKIYFLASII